MKWFNITSQVGAYGNTQFPHSIQPFSFSHIISKARGAMCRRVYIVFCCITYIVYTYIKRKSGKANFMLVVRVWKPYKYLLEWRHILLYFCAHIMLNSKHFIIISYVFFFLVLYVCQQLIIFYYVKVIVRLHKLRIFFLIFSTHL